MTSRATQLATSYSEKVRIFKTFNKSQGWQNSNRRLELTRPSVPVFLLSHNRQPCVIDFCDTMALPVTVSRQCYRLGDPTGIEPAPEHIELSTVLLSNLQRYAHLYAQPADLT